MKTKLLLLFAIISAKAFSQEIFPTSDAIWNIQINGREFYYGLSGDTIINEKTYSKLYSLNDTTLNIDPEDFYEGAIRVEGQQVWFRPVFFESLFSGVEASEETLLYDFSVNVGDTIWHNLLIQLGWTYMNENITASIVEEVDDTEGVKTYHTRQYVNGYDNGLHSMMGQRDICMEGIGSLDSGLFYFLVYPPMSGGASFHLACFKQGNEVKYVDNPKCNSCFCYSTAGISENEPAHITVRQENDHIKISGVDYPCKIKLFDTMGQVRLDTTIASDNDPILITNKSKGVFLYQILKDNAIITAGKIRIK